MVLEALRHHLKDVYPIEAVEFAAYTSLLQKNKAKRLLIESRAEVHLGSQRKASVPMLNLQNNR